MSAEATPEKIDLPKGAAPVESQADNVVTIEQAIKKSKAEIQEAHSPKRGRGRPRLPRDEQGNVLRMENGPASPSVESPAATASAPAIDHTPILRQSLKLPFEMWAEKTKCSEIALTDDEINEPVYYLNELINAYLPDLMAQDPKKIAVWAFVGSMGLLTFKKLEVYNSHRSIVDSMSAAPSKAADSPPSSTPPAKQTPSVNVHSDRPIIPPNGIPASDYFAQNHRTI